MNEQPSLFATADLAGEPGVNPARVEFLAGLLSRWTLGTDGKTTEGQKEAFRAAARDALDRGEAAPHVEEALALEAAEMGRPAHLVASASVEGLTLAVYDLEPAEVKDRVMRQRRYVLTNGLHHDDRASGERAIRVSGIVRVRSERTPEA